MFGIGIGEEFIMIQEVRITREERDNACKIIAELLREVKKEKDTHIGHHHLGTLDRLIWEIKKLAVIECVYMMTTCHEGGKKSLQIGLVYNKNMQQSEEYEELDREFDWVNSELGKICENRVFKLCVFRQYASISDDLWFKRELFNSTILYDPTGKYTRKRDEIRLSGSEGYFSNLVLPVPPFDVMSLIDPESKVDTENSPQKTLK